MFDYASVAVEIWHLILHKTIEVPYVLDITQDRKGCYWYKQDLYHDVAAYERSEQQRTLLRQVCRSWQTFSDENKYRWITYNSNDGPNRSLWRNEVAKMQSAATSSLVSDWTCTRSRPQRITFNVTGFESVVFLSSFIEHFSNKLNTLFIECPEGLEDAVFERLINHSGALPELRCLMVKAPTSPSALQSISRAFPRLIDLAVKGSIPNTHSQSDRTVFLELEDLDLDMSAYTPETVERLSLPRLVHLATTLGDSLVATGMTLYPLRLYGSRLGFLNIHRLDVTSLPIHLPSDFWTWCPCLVEMRVFLCGVYFAAPAPAKHPLKYLVHWVNYDPTHNTPSVALSATGSPTPLLFQNLQRLPTGFEIVILSTNWDYYLLLLGETEGPGALASMAEITVKQAIRIEDDGGMGLDDFLAA